MIKKSWVFERKSTAAADAIKQDKHILKNKADVMDVS